MANGGESATLCYLAVVLVPRVKPRQRMSVVKVN